MEESSYGIIPVCKRKGRWEVLLIQHFAGHWGFPKGHAENDETPQQAAARELAEETGLNIVCYLSDTSLAEKYHFFSRGRHIDKAVTYFIAETTGEVEIQHDEIKAAKWVPLDESERHVTFPAAKAICRQALQLLQKEQSNHLK